MPRVATVLVTAIVAVGGGVLGAYGYDELIAEDDAPVVAQQPLTQSTKPDNDNAEEGALTPAEIYEKTSPGVVLIKALVTQETQSPFGEPEQQQGTSTGTGFVVSEEGYIVTNAHVVEGAKQATVQFGEDKAVLAQIRGTDVNSDLAVLKIDPKAHELTPLTLGKTTGLRVGDPVVAIGNPFGLDRTLTTGVVSALARRIEGLNGFQIKNVVQTDAAINKGNSGGPLIDAAGQVIGVNSQIQTESGGNVGIGFAVPVERLKEVLPTLEAGKEVEVAYLGVKTVALDERQAKVVRLEKGLVVAQVIGGSPAAKAGLKAGDSGITADIDGSQVDVGGDVILAVDGQELTTAAELSEYVEGKKVGDVVTLRINRGGKDRDLKVTLGTRPATLTPQP